MTTPRTPGAWLALLVGHLTTNDALQTAGEALTCDDASRYVNCVARCGAVAAAVAVWHAHLTSCPERDHEPLGLPGPAPSGQAADALLRDLHQPGLLRAVAATWGCHATLNAAVAAHVLNPRSFVSRDLVLAHVEGGCDRHGQVVTLLDARRVILDHLDVLDRAAVVAG